MGVSVTSDGAVALYDSVSGVAFGPTFDSVADAEAFLDFLREIGERDPRVIPSGELAVLRREWEEDREAADV